MSPSRGTANNCWSAASGRFGLPKGLCTSQYTPQHSQIFMFDLFESASAHALRLKVPRTERIRGIAFSLRQTWKLFARIRKYVIVVRRASWKRNLKTPASLTTWLSALTSGGASLIDQRPHHSLSCIPHCLPATFNRSSNPVNALYTKPRLLALRRLSMGLSGLMKGPAVLNERW